MTNGQCLCLNIASLSYERTSQSRSSCMMLTKKFGTSLIKLPAQARRGFRQPNGAVPRKAILRLKAWLLVAVPAAAPTSEESRRSRFTCRTQHLLWQCECHDYDDDGRHRRPESRPASAERQAHRASQLAVTETSHGTQWHNAPSSPLSPLATAHIPASSPTNSLPGRRPRRRRRAQMERAHKREAHLAAARSTRHPRRRG